MSPLASHLLSPPSSPSRISLSLSLSFLGLSLSLSHNPNPNLTQHPLIKPCVHELFLAHQSVYMAQCIPNIVLFLCLGLSLGLSFQLYLHCGLFRCLSLSLYPHVFLHIDPHLHADLGVWCCVCSYIVPLLCGLSFSISLTSPLSSFTCCLGMMTRQQK